MGKIIMYLLESSAVLAFFYLLYVLILRRETFFSLNRFFLLGILVFSMLFPFMSFDFNPGKVEVLEHPVKEISKFRMSYFDTMAKWEFENFSGSVSAETAVNANSAEGSGFRWLSIVITGFLMLYAIGVVVCLSRVTMALRWLWKMIATYPHEKIDNMKVVKLPNPVAPFSFLEYVFIHEGTAGSPEFDQILAHEKTHIQQRHSIDLIFVQLVAAFLWFNPLIWKLIKSLKTTHEYIADEKIMNAGYSLVEYQTMLLSQLISNNSYGLVHNFNLSFIKKRIAMMKNNKSGWSGKVKVAGTIIAGVVASIIFVQCNSKIEEQVSPEPIESVAAAFTNGINLPVLPEIRYKFNGDLNDAVNLTIAGDKVMINEKDCELGEMVSAIEKSGLSEKGIIVTRIDKDQKMKLVRDVLQELRKADRRKLLYLGQTRDGKKVETALLLPPTAEHAINKYNVKPVLDPEEYIAAGKLDPLRIDLGRKVEDITGQEIYDFVMSHVNKNSTDYLVVAKYNDDDTYGHYLSNFLLIQEGFRKIYEEQAQKVFGKDYYDLGKEEFASIRKNIPMSVAVSD